MTTHVATDYEAVLHKVSAWTAADRFSFIQDVLKTLAPTTTVEDENAVRDRRRQAWRSLRGIARTEQAQAAESPEVARVRQEAFDRLDGALAGHGPTPTDEDIERWKDERLMEKYGR